MNPGLIKQFTAESALAPRTLVKFGAADGAVATATGSTDKLVGVADSIGSNSAGRVDVIMGGIAEVVLGGGVTRGDYLVATTGGEAIAQTSGAGVNAEVIGKAMVSGVAGDVIDVFINPVTYQG
jgi:hypothetical protein